MPVGDPSTSTFPFVYDDQLDILPDQRLGDPGLEGDLIIDYIFAQLGAIQHTIGDVTDTNPATIYNQLRQISGSDAGLVVNVTDWGVKTSANGGTAAANVTAFNAIETAITTACTFWFPAGDYPVTGSGFNITKQGHGILGAGGNSRLGGSGAGTRFTVSGTGVGVDIKGSTVGGESGREYGMFLAGVQLSNSGTGTNIGLRLRHLTHFWLHDVAVSGFRGNGGGLQAYNTMDGMITDMSIDFCGSADNTNKAAVLFTATNIVEGGAVVDACNSIVFLRLRMENISDRFIHFQSVGGSLVNKIKFLATKFESSTSDGNGTSGPNDSTQAAFLYDNASYIDYTAGTEFTIQNRKTAYVLPRMHALRGGSWVSMTDVTFHFGAGTFPKVFTYFVDASGSGNNFLTLANVWVHSGNSGAFPTQVLKGANSPKLSQKGVGFHPFQGSAKVATDWFTTAEWVQNAGVIA